MADETTRLQKVKTLTGETDETLLGILLSVAEQKVLNRLYPFDDTQTVIPARYDRNVVEIAVYLYNRLGTEGELEHNEGDTQRRYASASVPSDMFAGIIPYAGVL